MLVPAALLASACAATAGGSATGSGWITSRIDPTSKANFGFTFDCGKDPACTTPKVSGQYDDKGASRAFLNGARLRVVSVVPGGAFGPFPDQPNCGTATINYDSQEPKAPGSGTAIVSACDNGHGSDKAADTFSIFVLDGPFAGYANPIGAPFVGAPLQGGQIKVIVPPPSPTP